ncbi:hypothetical protein LA080_004778 [Diaporthe eres]|nr:hypothetical protein LA080_004778 [Diaporthe eres]
MAQPASEPNAREVRQLFGQLYDQAAGLAESLRPCDCGAGYRAQDGQELNAMVQELLAVRQRVGCCICGPPCDGTSVDDASDEFLDGMLAKLRWDWAKIDDNLVPCDCAADRPEVVEEPKAVEEPEVVEENPSLLLRLPVELRSMIWWRVLQPPPRERENASRGFVRVVQRLLDPAEEITDLALQRPRSSIYMGGEPPHALTFERQDEHRERRNPRGRWALLFVNRQIQREAENEFWRRTFADGLVLSFMADFNVYGDDHYGILAAWTWFDNYRRLYSQQIRRLQLNLAQPATDQPLGLDVRFQALQKITRPPWGSTPASPYPRGSSNGAEVVRPLLDTVARDLPNLQELAVTIGGIVPDMRFGSPLRSSRPWVTRLQNIRGLTRLRLRVIFAPPRLTLFFDDPAAVNNDSDVQHTVHFVSTLRGSMLANGQALGDEHILRRAMRRYDGSQVVVVECDDSWDEETWEHTQHRDGDDPDDGSWDDGDLVLYDGIWSDLPLARRSEDDDDGDSIPYDWSYDDDDGDST